MMSEKLGISSAKSYLVKVLLKYCRIWLC